MNYLGIASVLADFKLGNYKTVLTWLSLFNRNIQDKGAAISTRINNQNFSLSKEISKLKMKGTYWNCLDSNWQDKEYSIPQLLRMEPQ